MKQCLFVPALLGLIFFASCKKSDTNNLTTSQEKANALKDTSLWYSQDIYLWHHQIPSNFNPRDYTDPGAVMKAVQQYSVEPGFSKPVDRWSFAVKQAEWNNTTAGISSGDFGLGIFFPVDGDLRVKYVEKASPAGLAGIRRGWRILSINGNSNITISNVDFIIKNIFESTTANIFFQKPDNTTATITLNSASYKENPFLVDTIYSINARKVGYFCFNSFLGDTTEIYTNFSRIFNRYVQENVQDVIVDLRYNGGGYVALQEKLANWLAPTAANGQVMMIQQFNDSNSKYNTTTYFNKLGTLNLSRIFFIVSQSTASASELLINNLKPYMNVKLIGPSPTHGKPVGFFAIPVGDWYIFPVSFRTTNRNGEGNYFNGLSLDSQLPDGVDKEWGDLEEYCLQSAARYIATGIYRRSNDTKEYPEQARVKNVNIVLDQTSFKGAVDTRKIK